MATDWAIVVGLNKYKHPEYPPLRGAVRDAGAFLTWLRKKSGADFGPGDKRIFTHIQKKRGEPRLDAIDQSIEYFLDRIPGRLGRRLYVYMAGHGVGKAMTDIALLAGDHTEAKDSVLEGRRYADMFCETAAFDEVLLFMDCCRDRLDYRSRWSWNYDADPDAAEVKQCYGFGAQYNRSSYEEKFSNRYHGVFSYYLMEGLQKGAASDENGTITAGNLEDFVKRQYQDRGEDYPPAFHFSDRSIVVAENVKPQLAAVDITLKKPGAGFEIHDGKEFARLIDVKRTQRSADTWRVRLRLYHSYVITSGDQYDEVRPPEATSVTL